MLKGPQTWTRLERHCQVWITTLKVLCVNTSALTFHVNWCPVSNFEELAESTECYEPNESSKLSLLVVVSLKHAVRPYMSDRLTRWESDSTTWWSWYSRSTPPRTSGWSSSRDLLKHFSCSMYALTAACCTTQIVISNRLVTWQVRSLTWSFNRFLQLVCP